MWGDAGLDEIQDSVSQGLGFPRSSTGNDEQGASRVFYRLFLLNIESFEVSHEGYHNTGKGKDRIMIFDSWFMGVSPENQ